MLPQWVFISRIFDKSSQETYGSGFRLPVVDAKLHLSLCPVSQNWMIKSWDFLASHSFALKKTNQKTLSHFMYTTDTIYM